MPRSSTPGVPGRRFGSGPIAELAHAPGLACAAFEQLFELSHEALLVTNETTILDCNSAALQLLEYTSEELVGQDILVLIADSHLDGSEGDPVERMNELQAALLERSTTKLQWRVRTNGGTEIDAELGIAAISAGSGPLLVVTIRRRSEIQETNRTLGSELAQQRRLLDAIPVPITIKDALERVVWVNPAYTEFFQIDAEHVLGKRIDELRLDPRDVRGLVRRSPSDVDAASGQLTGAGTVYLPDGAPREVLGRVRLYDVGDGTRGMVVAYTDITALKDMERAETAARESLKSLTDNVPIALYVSEYDPITRKAPFTYLSDGFEAVWGMTTKRALADIEEVLARVHPGDIEELRTRSREAAVSLQPFTMECRIEPTPGQMRWVQFASKPRRIHDGKVLFSGYVRNIDGEKERELELRAAKELAEAAGRVRSEFLSNMSHEIRTPMNAIIGMAHLTMQTELSAKQTEYVSKIQQASQQLLELLNTVLDSSKVETRKPAERTPFDLDDVIQNVASLVGEKAAAKDLSLTFDVGTEVPKRLVGDAQRLSQVLLNFTTNAVSFTERGGVEVRIVLHRSTSELVELHVAVKDSGAGLTAEEQAQVFQSLTQADGPASRRYGGTARGLALSRDLIELMGGTIGVSSAPGRGSTFWFTLPFGWHGRPVVVPAANPSSPTLDERPKASQSLRRVTTQVRSNARVVPGSAPLSLTSKDPAEVTRLVELLQSLYRLLAASSYDVVSLAERERPRLDALLGAYAGPFRTSLGAFEFERAAQILAEVAVMRSVPLPSPDS